MPPGPVILTLSSWVQQHLREVITANSQSAFTDAMNAFVAPNAQITFNGASISRADYVQQIWQPQQHESNATLSFLGIIENPKDTSAIVQVGEVGVFYSANIEQPPLLFSNIETSSLNVDVEEQSKPANAPPEFDGRLVVALNQVLVTRPSNEQPLPGNPRK